MVFLSPDQLIRVCKWHDAAINLFHDFGSRYESYSISMTRRQSDLQVYINDIGIELYHLAYTRSTSPVWLVKPPRVDGYDNEEYIIRQIYLGRFHGMMPTSQKCGFETRYDTRYLLDQVYEEGVDRFIMEATRAYLDYARHIKHLWFMDPALPALKGFAEMMRLAGVTDIIPEDTFSLGDFVRAVAKAQGIKMNQRMQVTFNGMTPSRAIERLRELGIEVVV